MPAIDSIKKGDHTKIIVWEVTEPENILLETLSLPTEEIKRYRRMTLKRQKEFLGIRCALKNLGLSLDLQYDSKGKPCIDKRYHVSLSHTYERVAVAKSNYPIGIDIEKLRAEKILQIRKKFLRSDEATFIDPKDEIAQLHIIWGIKESLYKLRGGGLSSFLNHYKVSPFSMSDRRIKCWIIEGLLSKSFWAYHRRMENYHLVYTIDHE